MARAKYFSRSVLEVDCRARRVGCVLDERGERGASTRRARSVDEARELAQSIAIYRSKPLAAAAAPARSPPAAAAEVAGWQLARRLRGACARASALLLAGDDVMQSPLGLRYHLRAFLQSTPTTRAA